MFSNMDSSFSQIIQKIPVSNLGYVIYQPKTSKVKESFHFNREAHEILSYTSSPSRKRIKPHLDVLLLYMKWKKTLDKRLKEKAKAEGKDTTHGSFIELFKSGKRQYIVRGVRLYEDESSSEQNTQYMFILERIRSDLLNIPKIAREWNLNTREQDVRQLLFSDMSNKEIAHALGLTLNTVKTYIKHVMRKLGVSSRAGIISRILIEKKMV